MERLSHLSGRPPTSPLEMARDLAGVPHTQGRSDRILNQPLVEISSAPEWLPRVQVFTRQTSDFIAGQHDITEQEPGDLERKEGRGGRRVHDGGMASNGSAFDAPFVAVVRQLGTFIGVADADVYDL